MNDGSRMFVLVDCEDILNSYSTAMAGIVLVIYSIVEETEIARINSE